MNTRAACTIVANFAFWTIPQPNFRQRQLFLHDTDGTAALYFTNRIQESAPCNCGGHRPHDHILVALPRCQGGAFANRWVLMVLPVPCLLLLGVSMLLMHAGIPPTWTLGSLALAFVSTGIGIAMLNTKNAPTYENG